MTTSSKTEIPDLTALAAEACDLWQEHLATYAQDPEAKAAMLRMMEPQRQLLSGLFADYATMVQNAQHGSHPSTPRAHTASDAPTSGPTAASSSSDDIALRVAQLAHRVAYLEKHCAELEKRLGRYEHRRNGGTSEVSQSPETD